MIEVNGSIFDAQSLAIVNPVNCVGVMGKGLALEFKNRYPKTYQEYKIACENKQLTFGKVLSIQSYADINAAIQLIIHFPTKYHWSEKSHIANIASGLKALREEADHLDLPSIAIPALGCGLGGLKWSDVKLLIELEFSDFLGKIYLYPPK